MTAVRAIVFDLDDTLYPYRAFLQSGFRAVGRRVADEYGLPPATVLRVLRRALVGEGRGREVQTLCAAFRLPVSIAPALIAIIRNHTPTLRLPCESARVLEALRRSWKVGILTNGTPHIQRRKIDALNLHGLVDTVVFATECGNGTGKPAAESFHAVLASLGAEPQTTVFVGDDEAADINGASAVGLKTIHILGRRSPEPRCGSFACGAHVSRLDQIPNIAELLVPSRTPTHAL